MLAPCLDLLKPLCEEDREGEVSSLDKKSSLDQTGCLSEKLRFGALLGEGQRVEELLSATDGQIWEMRRKCARYGLLLLRNVQGMTATHFSDFMSRWGRLQPDYQVDQDMSFEPSESTERSPMVFGNGGAGEHLYSDAWSWHFDGEDMPWLHSYTSLYCLIRPHEGHSTGFAATNRCVDFMPEELRFLLEGARAEYSTDDIVESYAASESEEAPIMHEDFGKQLKPILRRHSNFSECHALQIYDNRKRIILRNGSELRGEPARILSDALYAFAVQPAFQYLLPWQEHSLVIWDNQSCQHAVIPYDYEAERRKMWRVTTAEDEPHTFWGGVSAQDLDEGKAPWALRSQP